ncbi:MAG: hypothetical protein KKG96_10585 [Proteobacteria bacterium]|nr:hypothetical protein [Pseudomonadota bacterium]
MLINRLPAEIRDECRGDHKISKSALIEIARKKQERGMLTAWDAYKDKQLKAKTTRQKKDPNDSQAHLDIVDKTMTKIQSIDTSAWTEEAKTSYQTALTSLKDEIEKYLFSLLQ